MTVSLTELYEILSAKIGKEEAKTMVTFIEEKVEKQVEQKINYMATKSDLNDLERHINIPDKKITSVEIKILTNYC